STRRSALAMRSDVALHAQIPRRYNSCANAGAIMAEDILENAAAKVASGQAERRDRAPTWAGLGLKTREILVVTLFTLFVVATTTLFHLSYVIRLTLEETYRHAEVLARQFYGVSAGAIARAADRDPAD